MNCLNLDGLIECPVCFGPGEEMGTLGTTIWAKCRACGTAFVGASIVPPKAKKLSPVEQLRAEILPLTPANRRNYVAHHHFIRVRLAGRWTLAYSDILGTVRVWAWACGDWLQGALSRSVASRVRANSRTAVTVGAPERDIDTDRLAELHAEGHS